MRFLSLSVMMLAGVLAAGPAMGAITTYTSYSLWQAAVTSPDQVTFDTAGTGLYSGYLSYTGGTYATTTGSCSVSSDPAAVCFSRVNGSTHSSMVDFAMPPAPTSGNRAFVSALADNPASRYVQIGLNTSVRAFAMDLYTYSDGGQTVTVSVYAAGSGTPTTYTVNTSVQPFFALTSDDPLDTVRLSLANSSQIQLDTFSFATALAGGGDPPPPTADSPESATMGYIGFGLIALVVGRNRLFRH